MEDGEVARVCRDLKAVASEEAAKQRQEGGKKTYGTRHNRHRSRDYLRHSQQMEKTESAAQ